MEIITISDSDDDIEITGYNPPSAPTNVAVQETPNNSQPTNLNRGNFYPASTSSQSGSNNPLKRKATKEWGTPALELQKRQCIDISDDEVDPPPLRRPFLVKKEPPILKRKPSPLERELPSMKKESRISSPAPRQPIPTTVKSFKASPSLSVMDLDFEGVDLSDELILTETEYLSDEGSPARSTIYPSPQRQTHLSPESFTYPKLDALTLTQQGEATIAHSDSIPLDYSQLTSILPSRLRTTTDYMIAHFCKLKLGTSRTEERPKVALAVKQQQLSRSRRYAERQLLKKKLAFHLGGGIESLAVSSLGVIASSSTKGGDAADTELDPDPYNMPNNLAMHVARTDEVRYLNEHSRQFDRTGRKAVKYYAVSNVAVDSKSQDHFYSVGHDCWIRQWKVTAEQCIQVAQKSFPDGPPFYVECHPKQPLLAVGCMDGSLFYAHNPCDTGINLQKLDLVEDGSAKAGNLAWGTGPSQSLLFSCVESLAEGSRARNKYFDFQSQCSSPFTPPGLDSNNMALSNNGSSIALCAHNLEKDLGQMLFFDIRTSPQPTCSVATGLSDVSTMAFSPDDIYLALGRENNKIEVWDTRYISSSPMLQLSHFDGVLPQDESFGIARHLHWVERRHRFGTGLGLVTGGDGGSLCLWDVQKAEGSPEGQHVLAESAFSITTVLIPEPTDLYGVRAVIGDAGGNVTLYH